MTRDVLITLRGVQQMPQGDPQEIEMIVPGEYFFEDGTHTLVYDEIMEDLSGNVHNVTKFSSEVLDVTRTGVVETRMIFHPGEREMTHYETPMGEILIEIDTQELKLTESEDLLSLVVDYSLGMNYEPVSLNQISIQAAPRTGGYGM